jgi:prevent-host-death family protein
MKSVELAEAKRALAEYAREAQRGTVVVTRRGKPMAAVVPLRGVDLESLAVSTSPDFIDVVERARARFLQTGGISLEEMKRRWGGKQAPPPKARRALARRSGSTSATRPARRSR